MIRAIATVGLNTLETSLVKATFEDDERPKAKHVRTIMDFIEFDMVGTGQVYSNNSQNSNIISLLQKRVSSSSWRVVFKTLIVIHTLCREANVVFVEEFLKFGIHTIFSITNKFDDMISSDSIMQSKFIRQYSQYLHDKLNNYQAIGFNIERKLDPTNKDFFKEYSVNTLGKILPKLNQQLSKLLECVPFLGLLVVVHEIQLEAMLLLIKDSLRLYPGIQLCLWQLLCSFQKLNLEQARWGSRAYDKYFQLNKQFREWMERNVKYSIIDYKFVPDFDTLPESLAQKLKYFINEKEKEEANDEKDNEENNNENNKDNSNKKKNDKKKEEKF